MFKTWVQSYYDTSYTKGNFDWMWILKNSIDLFKSTYNQCPLLIQNFTKSLKIPKGQSESVYRKRKDNTMAKIKSRKDKQHLQNIRIKLKIG